MKCPCGIIYVGETTRPIKRRIGEHKCAVRAKDLRSPVSRHFSEHMHTVSQLRFQIIDGVPPLRRGGDRELQLLQLETFWIYTLDSLAPHGMNENINYQCFLPIR